MRDFSTILLAGFVLFASLATIGCRGETADAPPRQYFPDLDDQLKYKAQDESSFFADGRTMREPPVNTVAFGRTEHTGNITGFTRTGRALSVDFAEREELLRENTAFYAGLNDDGSLVEDIPIEVTRDLIEVGRENYSIYCIVCHGGLGEGDGLVGQRWSTPIPSFLDAAILKGGSEEKGSDGYIYDKIRNGVANPGGAFPLKMPAYSTKVNERESWAIVAYIRTIQKARNGTFEELPDRMQLQMDRSAGANEDVGETDGETLGQIQAATEEASS